MKTEEYRYDTAFKTLYKFDKKQDAYLFCCKNPFNLSEKKLIEEHQSIMRA